MTNKYDKEFVGFTRRGALSNKMFELIKAHPEDQDIIFKAYFKQKIKIVEHDQIVYKDCMTEY